jgi:hypothetical protein
MEIVSAAYEYFAVEYWLQVHKVIMKYCHWIYNNQK